MSITIRCAIVWNLFLRCTLSLFAVKRFATGGRVDGIAMRRRSRPSSGGRYPSLTSWYPHTVSEDLQLDEYRILLVNERRKLVERSADGGIAAGERPSASAVLDSGQVAAWRGEGRSTAEQLQDALKEVDDAIERIDQGTYGICQSCHGSISPERLEAMPASIRCIKCASRM